MFTIQVRYGMQTEPKSSDSPITIGQIRRDSSLRAILGYGDNVTLLVGGIAMPDDAIVPNNAEVVAETTCNTKA
jgi:hypothetical protein